MLDEFMRLESVVAQKGECCKMISIQLSTFVSILRATIPSSERMIWYKFFPSFHVKEIRMLKNF